METSGQPDTTAALLTGKQPSVFIEQEAGRFGEEKTLVQLWGF
jgi:hypothetical protein